MQRTLRLVALVVFACLAVFPIPPGHAETTKTCATYTVLANSTVPSTTTVFQTEDHVLTVGAWLAIVDAGGGTVSVAVKGYGSGKDSTTANPVATLCTLNAATTFCRTDGPIFGLQAVVTGCTTTCSLVVKLCGLGER